jgi:hypothetical protein
LLWRHEPLHYYFAFGGSSLLILTILFLRLERPKGS